MSFIKFFIYFMICYLLVCLVKFLFNKFIIKKKIDSFSKQAEKMIEKAFDFNE